MTDDREAYGRTPCFIIHFQDKEMIDEHFSGEGAEEAAKNRFDVLRDNWSCSLYREIART